MTDERVTQYRQLGYGIVKQKDAAKVLREQFKKSLPDIVYYIHKATNLNHIDATGAFIKHATIAEWTFAKNQDVEATAAIVVEQLNAVTNT